MKIDLKLTRILILSIGCILAACDDNASNDEDTDTKDNTDAVPKTVSLAEVNNYTYQSALHIPTVETAPGSDIEICWKELTRDFQCHDMDPKLDIDNATVVRIRNMSEAEIEEALGQDGLQQSNIDGYLVLKTEGKSDCVNLADFSFFGSEVTIGEEYVVSDERKYLLVLTTGTTPGVGARIMTFMTPVETSDNRTVNVGEGCDLLDFSATLTSLTPMKVSADGQTTLDWSDLAPPKISRVMLGFYENMTPTDLEAQVLDLMLIATKKWELAVEAASSVDLSELIDADGASFERFEGTGSWIFALLCETCQNPAPPFVSLLEPVKGSSK